MNRSDGAPIDWHSVTMSLIRSKLMIFLCYSFTAYFVQYFQLKVMRHDTGDFMRPKCPMTSRPGPLV